MKKLIEAFDYFTSVGGDLLKFKGIMYGED